MLKKNLLHGDGIDDGITGLSSCFNAKGQYVPMHFVIRLRVDIHKKLDGAINDLGLGSNLDFDTLQAFSTYFHETIHWWQHIGSTSGFTLTLSHPSQTHINSQLLAEFAKTSGLIKSITSYNDKNATEFNPTTREFMIINQLLNNFHDIEFFKLISFNSSYAREIQKNRYFESWGHCNIVTFINLWAVISSPFDDLYRLKFTPDTNRWNKEYEELHNKRAHNFYHGSTLYVTKIGILELYEGQARFSQMQYLYLASGNKICWDEFERMGMLEGEYYLAFSDFLKALDIPRPPNVLSPQVGLFLLLIDIAINPSEGFPFDIKEMEGLVEAANPGYRFYRLCQAINEIYPYLKSGINDYSSAEYVKISGMLARAIGCRSPYEIATEVCTWRDKDNFIADLMEEEKSFVFDQANMPIRLIFSKFIKFQEDKQSRPEFFCWPGVFMTGEKASAENLMVFARNQSLFCDGADGDIYPRKQEGITDERVNDTFMQFYTWMAYYQFCRQWITEDGPFDYDFLWLTSKFSNAEVKEWVDRHFVRLWGFSPDEFKTS